MAFWWAPCVFPSKMVGSWWAPCVFPSKMGSARMKFKWFFCRDIWVSHCYILGQPGRSQIQCHLPCTKILTQSGTSTVRCMCRKCNLQFFKTGGKSGLRYNVEQAGKHSCKSNSIVLSDCDLTLTRAERAKNALKCVEKPFLSSSRKFAKLQKLFFWFESFFNFFLVLIRVLCNRRF